MNPTPAALLLTALLTLLLVGCGTDEPRTGSGPIDLREPREVAPTTDRAELAGVNGEALITEVLPILMNLLAKYEIAADRYEVAVDGDAVQDERARLRAYTNQWFALARRDGVPVPVKPGRARYATTEALSELPAPRFRAAFGAAVALERRELTELLVRFQRRKLPLEYLELARSWTP